MHEIRSTLVALVGIWVPSHRLLDILANLDAGETQRALIMSRYAAKGVADGVNRCRELGLPVPHSPEALRLWTRLGDLADVLPVEVAA